MNNPNGVSRFEFYLTELEQMLADASKDINPALWLYSSKARTTLFMLEGLSKLYEGLHNSKRFEKIKEHFKALEDSLGSIDYYDSFAKEFAGNPLIPQFITDYLQGQAREKIQRLNDLLKEKKWIGGKAVRIKKIREKLRDADWRNPKDELKGIFEFYRKAVNELKEFMQASGAEFTEIEAQVHEIRRDLRWLSIYPQALQGVIQLKESTIMPEYIEKYLTPEIVNSSFNKMPLPGNNSYFLLLEKKYFLALSWVIAELGKLKDSGLKILAVAEAFQQKEGLNHESALQKTYDVLGFTDNILQEILLKASDICNNYFGEKNADKLIYGITATLKDIR